MNSANRTLAFVLIAACSVAVAVGAHRMYQPSGESQRSDVGAEFYPEFKDPLSATSLSVAAYNPDSSKVDRFIVEKRDGQWRIPSHHNYPADAKDRLARTAASIIGVTRGQLVDETGASHEKWNLIDPLDEKRGGTEGRGSRIILKDGDTVLTDLIIGKKEEGTAAGADRYYVRRADEERVYIAEIRPELSTKFTDWIQPNVLDATAATFRQMILDRYSVDEVQGRLVPGDRSVLTRASASDEWKLEGIAEDKKVKTSVVNQMTTALGDMKIVGVRPKTPGIAALIKGDPKARRTAVDMLDMQDKGYFDDGKGGIVSNEGDFLAGSSEGIIYVLRFGKAVLGEDVDIEIGSSKKLSEEEAQKALEERKAKGEDAAKPEADNADGADKKEGDEPKKESRFLFVTAQVNEELLGEAPVEPVKPKAPEGYKPKEKPVDAPPAPNIPGFNDPTSKKPEDKPANPPSAPGKETSSILGSATSFAGPGPDQDEPKVDTPAAEATPEQAPAAKVDEKPVEEPKPDEQKTADAAKVPATKPAEATAPAAEQPAAPAADEKKPEAAKDPFAEYEAALAKFEQELDEYRVRKGEYDEKLKKAKDREKALNARFADWYYVIPVDVFNTLNVKPDDLVEPAVASTTDAGAPPAAPGFPPPAAGPLGGATAPVSETPPVATPSAAPPAATPSPEKAATPPQVDPEKPADPKPPATDAPATDAPATDAPATKPE